MSITKVNRHQKTDLETLRDELEERYGPAAAQEIVDQIEKAANSGRTPDCLLVKALCDMKVLFRSEAQELAKSLRNQRKASYPDDIKVTPISRPIQEAEFRHIFRLYWISMKLFYPWYDQALADAEKPLFPKTSPQMSGTPLCLAFAA